MGGPRPLIQGEKKDGAAKISGEPAPARRPARRQRVDDMDQPVSLEKLRGMGGQPEEGETRNGKNKVRVA